MRDLAVVDVLQGERHHRPADVDLAGHGLGVGAGHAAGRHRLGLGAGLLEQRQQDQVRRRARRRERDGLAVGVLEGLDRAVGLDPPEQLVGAGHLRRDDAVGRGFAALHIGADGAEDAVRHRDIDAAGGDGGDRLRAAFGVEHLDLEAGVLEEAGGLAELDPGAVPESLLRDRDLELLDREARAGSRHQDGERSQDGSFHRIPPSAFGRRVAVGRDSALPSARGHNRPTLCRRRRIDRPRRALHNRGCSVRREELPMRVPTFAIAAIVLSAASVDAAACPVGRRDHPGRSGVQPDLQRRLYRERSQPVGQARHQGEDRGDHRHRRHQLGDLRQLAFRAGLGELVRPRQRARAEADRHRHHHRPAVRAGGAAQGDRRGRRLRCEVAA